MILNNGDRSKQPRPLIEGMSKYFTILYCLVTQKHKIDLSVGVCV